jgi:hypothetical protein
LCNKAALMHEARNARRRKSSELKERDPAKFETQGTLGSASKWAAVL